MADWTVILTSAAAAGVTGGFGYLGIRRSTDVTKQQMAEETTRSREQIEAENERLRIQHREEHLRNRQGTYRDLLAVDRKLADAMRFGKGDVPEAFETFSDLGDGVHIFGTDRVKDAITEVLAGYVYVARDAENRAGDKPMGTADMRAAFEEQAQRIGAARTALMEAMREDVGPGGEPNA